MVSKCIISGTGLFTPPYKITNQELVDCFNTYVTHFNESHQQDIQSGKIEALLPSSTTFIEKASGIRSRYVMENKGILNPRIMHPLNLDRKNNDFAIQAEMSVAAAKEAMEEDVAMAGGTTNG